MVALIRWVGRIWETAKILGLILWPIRVILLVMLAMVFVLCLTQAQDALFGSVIEWAHPWLTLVAVSIWALQTWYWSRFLLYLPPKKGADYLYTTSRFRDACYKQLPVYIPRALGVLVFLIVGGFIWYSSTGRETEGGLWLAVYVACGAVFYAFTAFRRLVINEPAVYEPAVYEPAAKRSVTVLRRLLTNKPTVDEAAAGQFDGAHRITPIEQLDVLDAPDADLKVVGWFSLGWLVLLLIMASSAVWQWSETERQILTITSAVVLAIAFVIVLWKRTLNPTMTVGLISSLLLGVFLFISSIASPAYVGISLGPAVVLMASAAMWVGATRETPNNGGVGADLATEA